MSIADQIDQASRVSLYAQLRAFGEPVEVNAAGGAPKSITAVVRVRVDQVGGDGQSVDIREICTVSAADHDSADFYGADPPQVGDRLLRSASRDPLRKAFTCTGVVFSHRAGSGWRAEYHRTRPAVGGRGAAR